MYLGREFVFKTFEEAMDVHRKIYDKVREHGFITCHELYCMIGFMDNERIYPSIYYTHGWTNLWEVKLGPIENCANGTWILKMPQIKRINREKEND